MQFGVCDSKPILSTGLELGAGKQDALCFVGVEAQLGAAWRSYHPHLNQAAVGKASLGNFTSRLRLNC